MSILNNSIAMSVSITKIGIRKKVDSRKIQLREGQGENPEADAIGVNKELIHSEAFDAITRLDNDFRSTLYRKSLPNPLFRNGTYLVPVASLEDIDQYIQDYKEKRSELVDNFVSEYSDSVYAARNRLGGLFNISDYPAIENVKSAFTVTHQYIEIGLPESIGTISPEIFQRERAAFQDRLVSASEEITAAMRESFLELVSHMSERLKSDGDGKKKIFRDSLVNNLREFMDSFSVRNITDDSELEKIVNQARTILNGKSADDLRNMDSIRNQVQSGMQEIKEQLSGMVTIAPKRKFSFDD